MKNILKKNNYFILIFASLGALLIPYLEFITHNIEALEPFLFKSLFQIFIFFLIFYFLSTATLYFLFKLRLINSIHISSIIFLVIFSYDKFKAIIYFIFKETDFKFFGEISLLLVISLICLVIVFNKKNYFNFFKFINLYIILTVLFSFSVFFYKIDLNLIKQKNYNQLEKKLFFNDEEIQEIKSSRNNKNIYYLIFDAAIPLENYNKTFKSIDIKKEVNFWKKNGFSYVNNIKSSYDGTHLTISQIFNMDYLITNKSDKYTSFNTFPTTMTKFNETMAGKILKEINYDFYWIGNAMQNCRFYLISSCLRDISGYQNNLNSLISNTTNYLNSNYILVTFLQKTPFMDLGNKLFENFRSVNSAAEKAWYENDGAKKFFDYSNKLKNNSKNYFVFIHAIMPHGYSAISDKPNVYNKDCSRGSLTKKEAENSRGDNIIAKLSGELIGYESNYLCFIKRVRQFVSFINKFDPNGVVIITADHGINIHGMSNSIFFLSKLNKKCKNKISNQIDQINAIRLAISCATNQRVKLIKKRSFKRTETDLRKLREINLN